MKITWTQLKAALKELGAVAAVVVGAVSNNSTIPNGVRAALVGAGGFLLAISHFATTLKL